MRRNGLPLVLALVPALALPTSTSAAGQQYWDTYAFVEPYAGLRNDVAGGDSDAWKSGVRMGRVGWLTGWEGDLSIEHGDQEAGERDQLSLDGFLKPVETRYSSIMILAGLGVTRLRRSPDSDHHTAFHYRYGLAYRARFSEHFGLRVGLTALRSRAGDFSTREATLGPVFYF